MNLVDQICADIRHFFLETKPDEVESAAQYIADYVRTLANPPFDSAEITQAVTAFGRELFKH